MKKWLHAMAMEKVAGEAGMERQAIKTFIEEAPSAAQKLKRIVQMKFNKSPSERVARFAAAPSVGGAAAGGGYAARRYGKEKFGSVKLAAELTQAGREHIKPKNFAIPKGDGPGDTGKYPIHDAEHARNALTRVDQHGTPKEKHQVHAAVAEKYPGLAARSSVPGVQRELAKDKEGCSGTKMAAMRDALDFQKVAGALQRISSMANPMSHLGEHAYDVGGLGILAAPVADKLQAMARARLAGEGGDEEAIKRRQLISEPVGEAMELGGLGILAAPGIGQLAKGLRRGH